MTAHAHPHFSAWRVLLPIGLGTALSLMGDTAMYAVLPTHTAVAGVSLASVGILLSANRWIRLLLNGPAGLAYDRWPRRRLFVAAMFVGAISTALYAFTQGFWPLLVGRLLWGLAWSGIWVGGNTIILDVTTESDRGHWTGLYQLSFYLGSAVGFATSGLLTDRLGYHGALSVATGVTFLGALIAFFFLPETRGVKKDEGRRMKDDTAFVPTPSGFGGGGAARRDSRNSATLLYSVNRFVGAGVISATLGLLIQQRWGEVRLGGGSPIGVATLSGVMLGSSTLISMIAAPVAGHWSDRAGRWRVAAGGLALGILGLGLLALGNPAVILLGVPLTAIAGGSNQSLATASLGDHSMEEQRGLSLGWMHTFGDLTSAIAPPLVYGVLPLIGLPGIYLATAGLTAAMLLWAVRLAQVPGQS
ncbi:MAG: MFS transporter [Chloroflexi bacterium]|nr:MFS transporter [Chloroflexota bacterium]